MSTVAALLGEGGEALAEAGVPRPRSEARRLLEQITGLDASRLIGSPKADVSDLDAVRYRSWVARRAAREPFAYIVGHAEFWSLDFVVDPAVLIPRADSETLIDAVTQRFADLEQPLRVLDLGVGSGCLLLTLLSQYPNARGVGTDTSEGALLVARRNAEGLGLAGRARLELASWTQGIAGPFDVVISNPPYVRSGDIAGLEPEVSRFEPRGALDGGPDGLDGYRGLLPGVPALLAPDGALFLEIGEGQDDAVEAMAAPWSGGCRIHHDLAGIARCLELRQRAP
jgi:release factor glutamine methyltransferase